MLPSEPQVLDSEPSPFLPTKANAILASYPASGQHSLGSYVFRVTDKHGGGRGVRVGVWAMSNHPEDMWKRSQRDWSGLKCKADSGGLPRTLFLPSYSLL